MENKAENLSKSVQYTCLESDYEKVKGIFSDVNIASISQQAKMIKECLYVLVENNVDVKMIMRKCNCLSVTTIQEAQECFQKANGDIILFLQLLNEREIGGGQLHTDKEGNIIGIYSKCYCDIPMVVNGIQQSYCECSAGWFEKLFSSVLNKPVKVSIINTILNGNDNCIFEITI